MVVARNTDQIWQKLQLLSIFAVQFIINKKNENDEKAHAFGHYGVQYGCHICSGSYW